MAHLSKTVALTTLAIAGSLSLAGTAYGKPSTDSELRGYQACVNAAQAETARLDPTRSYLLKDGDSEKRYFINAYQWQDGSRVAIKVACSTSPNGRQLNDIAVSEGRYNRNNGRSNIDLAQK